VPLPPDPLPDDYGMYDERMLEALYALRDEGIEPYTYLHTWTEEMRTDFWLAVGIDNHERYNARHRPGHGKVKTVPADMVDKL